MTVYFCEDCFKTYSEQDCYFFTDNLGSQQVRSEVKSVCENTDEKNPLVKNGFCGGRIKVC